MALNTQQYFKNPAKVNKVYHAVPITTETDVFPVDATYMRDLSTLICINENASSRTLSIYLHDGTTSKLIAAITVPGSAGQTEASPAVRLLNDPAYQIPMVTQDAFGNYFFRVPPGCKLMAKSSAADSLFLLGTIEGVEA